MSNDLKQYNINYAFGDDINDAISQAKADKLARDLYNQKNAQDTIMEIQRQQVNVQQDAIDHSQAMELTYEQRIENQIDREWHANFKADMLDYTTKYDKYKMDRAEKDSMNKFMLSEAWDKQRIDQNFQNQLSKMSFAVDKEIEMAEKMLPIQAQALDDQYGVKIKHLPELNKMENSQKYFETKMQEMLLEKQGEIYKQSPEYQKGQIQVKMLQNMLEQNLTTTADRKEFMSQKQGLASLLSKHGFDDDPSNFAPGNWTGKNTRAVQGALSEWFPVLQSLAEKDPMGSKYPEIWDHYRAELSMLDRKMSGFGWGGAMSWLRNLFGSQSGRNTKHINQIMRTIQDMLASKATNQQITE